MSFLGIIRQLKFIKAIRNLIPQSVVNLFFHLPKAILAVLIYGYPARNLYIIGITGTDGKTTTATLIYEILKQAGFKVALVSTVCAKIGNADLSTGLHVTSPDPFQLQKLLRLIVNKRFKFVVLEVTSHGLDQFRVWGCNIKTAVLTNITHEHLDYHKTFRGYIKAKEKLFKKVNYSILNKEDKISYKRLSKSVSGKIITYGFKDADFTPESFAINPKLPGKFNLLNCLAAAAAAKTIMINSKIIKKTINDFSGIAGRLEEIKLGQDFRVFIDFAHTPNALKNALQTLKKMPHRKLIAVFGCAGLRDFKKRPKMGKISCSLADKVILTAEDPRTEDLGKIISQIEAGCVKKYKILKISNRDTAIKTAIGQAKPNDIIGIFGKGHEQSMCFGNKEIPWSDHEIVTNVLKKRLKT